jgi:hypothetical protein
MDNIPYEGHASPWLMTTHAVMHCRETRDHFSFLTACLPHRFTGTASQEAQIIVKRRHKTEGTGREGGNRRDKGHQGMSAPPALADRWIAADLAGGQGAPVEMPCPFLTFASPLSFLSFSMHGSSPLHLPPPHSTQQTFLNPCRPCYEGSSHMLW